MSAGVPWCRTAGRRSVSTISPTPRSSHSTPSRASGRRRRQLYRARIRADLSALRREVTMVESGPRLVAREDEDVSEADSGDPRRRRDRGAHRRRLHQSRAARKMGLAVGVDCPPANRLAIGSHVLLAVGRRPNTDDLGLDVAGVATDSRGYITVDDASPPMFPASGLWATAMAAGRSRTPPTTILRSSPPTFSIAEDRRVSHRISAYALYVDPPLGRVGMTETEARRTGRPVTHAPSAR